MLVILLSQYIPVGDGFISYHNPQKNHVLGQFRQHLSRETAGCRNTLVKRLGMCHEVLVCQLTT